MYRLPQIILFFLLATTVSGQSPHGDALKIDCSECHTSTGWTDLLDSLLFDHATTEFALEGTHQIIDCKMCHTSMVFSEAPMECIDCHLDVHNQSVGNDCARCHETGHWLVDDIPELHEQNGFPLMGVHTGLSCIECHQSETGLRFDRVGNDCINCHQEDFLTAQNPDHQASGFSTDCSDCHDPFGFGWQTDLVDHDLFPLVQGHALPSCSECHINNDFTNTSPECVSCHLNDYNNTSNPDHSSSQFSTDCDACHTIAGWIPSTLDHNNTNFPLMGEHVGVDCLECHTNGYAGTPTECEACHLDDYNNTSNPNHSAAQFPTDCASCHDENGWTPANFDHDQEFPIYSGKHDGEWNACADCHIDPNNFSVFSCIICHDDQADLVDEHDDVPGYVYDSNACFNCHPDGEE